MGWGTWQHQRSPLSSQVIVTTTLSSVIKSEVTIIISSYRHHTLSSVIKPPKTEKLSLWNITLLLKMFPWEGLQILNSEENQLFWLKSHSTKIWANIDIGDICTTRSNGIGQLGCFQPSYPKILLALECHLHSGRTCKTKLFWMTNRKIHPTPNLAKWFFAQKWCRL